MRGCACFPNPSTVIKEFHRNKILLRENISIFTLNHNITLCKSTGKLHSFRSAKPLNVGQIYYSNTTLEMTITLDSFLNNDFKILKDRVYNKKIVIDEVFRRSTSLLKKC